MPNQVVGRPPTIDCDELERGRPPQPRPAEQLQPTNAIATPPPPPVCTSAGADRRLASRHETPSEPCQLSKLVLSDSLHQLAEANFHADNNHLRHLHANMAAAAAADSSCAPQTQTNSNEGRALDALETLTNCSPPASQKQQKQQQQQQQQQRAPANAVQNGPRSSRAQAQREASLDTVHVVVGNESCDLDSAVSCLLMFHIISKMSDELNGPEKARTLYIPLLNTTRDSLEAKSEVLWFLAKTLNIDKSFLTCRDDIDWAEIKRNGVEVLITLVDHNYNDEFKDIGRVVEIIDHHQVQNARWLLENQAQLRLTLDTAVGSCTTLVAERLFYVYAEHHVSDEILLLIYGAVLLDTICLSEKAKRFTSRDLYLLRKLDQLLGPRRPKRDQLYKQLVEVKNSTRELDFERLMRRDLKLYRDRKGMRVAIASLFGMAAKEALGLAAHTNLELFLRQNQYEALIIMGLVADLDHSDSISRDLVLVSGRPALFEKLCEAFEADASKLDLVSVSGSEPAAAAAGADLDASQAQKAQKAEPGPESESLGGGAPLFKARVWLQRNVASSRKVLAPLLLKVLHDGAQ